MKFSKVVPMLAVLWILLLPFTVFAESFNLLWETKHSGFPYTFDIDQSGLFGLINDTSIIILNLDGSIRVETKNTNLSWIISISKDRYLIQNGGDGKESYAKIYDYRGTLLWKVGDRSLGIGEFSPSGKYIVFTDANWGNFRLFTTDGQLLWENEWGSPVVVFDQKEEYFSASHIGIFASKNIKRPVMLDSELDFCRWNTYFINGDKNILIEEQLPSYKLRLYDLSFNLLWSIDLDPSVRVKEFNDNIVCYNAHQLTAYSLEGVIIKTIQVPFAKIDDVVWLSRGLSNIILITVDEKGQKFVEMLDVNGKSIKKEGLAKQLSYMINPRQNLMYILNATNDSEFTVRCYRLD